MQNLITNINSIGRSFTNFSLPMLLQSTVLITLILALDFIIRKRVRAVFRYCIWMLVLVKLVLPTTLSSPLSLGYLLGDKLSHNVPQIERPVAVAGRPEHAFQTPLSQAVPPPIITPEITPEPEAVAVSPQSAVAPYSAPVSLSWHGLAFLIWLSAVTAMALLLIQRMFFVRGLLARSKDPDDKIMEIFRQCREQMRLRRPVSLKLSPLAASPSVSGLFRPTILIPQNLPAELSRQDYTSILLHELAHIKRGDLWVSLIQTILQIVYFYNPLLWLANAIIRNVREQAVDEMVLVAMAAHADAYPRSLLNISKLAFTRPAFSLRLIGVVESKKALINRIKHIVSRPFPKSAKLGIIGLLVILAVGALLLPMAAAKKDADTRTTADPFVTSLPNNLTVELLGVCKHPIEGRQWWKPDGAPLNEPPFDYQKEDRVYAGEKELAYEFAVRYSNIPEDMDSIFYAEPSNSSAGGTLSSDTKKNGKRLQEYKNGRLVSTISKLATVFDKDRKNCDIKIGISDGPWETIFESIRSKTNGTWGTSSQGRSEGGAIFGKPTEEEQKTWITITHTFDRRVYDLRTIALHRDGDIIKPIRSSGNSVTNATQVTLCFDMPLEYIKEFRVQTRKYQWLTFENVSLNPGKKTDVQIEVQDIPAKDRRLPSAADLNDPGYDNLSPYFLFQLFGEIGAKLGEALDHNTAPSQKALLEAQKIIAQLTRKAKGTPAEKDAAAIAQAFDHFKKNVEQGDLQQAKNWLSILEKTYVDAEQRFRKINERQSTDAAFAAIDPRSVPSYLANAEEGFAKLIFSRVAADRKGRPMFVDIDTGRVWLPHFPTGDIYAKEAPEQAKLLVTARLLNWVRMTGVDVAMQTDGQKLAVMGLDTRGAGVFEYEQWKKVRLEDIWKLAHGAEAGLPEDIATFVEAANDQQQRINCAAVTREGGLSKFYVTRLTDMWEPNEITFRYRVNRWAGADKSLLSSRITGEEGILTGFEGFVRFEVDQERLTVKSADGMQRVVLDEGTLKIHSLGELIAEAERLHTGRIDYDAGRSRVRVLGRGCSIHVTLIGANLKVRWTDGQKEETSEGKSVHVLVPEGRVTIYDTQGNVNNINW